MAWAAAGAGTALGAALMLVRETDAARIEADPEWERLNRPLGGREFEVRSSDGTRLHVESFGRADAPTIVLVHGWMCALRLWRYQLDSLAEDFHVIAYDARGHGRSGLGAGDDYSIEALAEDLHSVLDACALNSPVALGGHSMGAMTIAAWARDHPEDVRRRVRGAALLSTGLDDLITESLVLRAPARLGDTGSASVTRCSAVKRRWMRFRRRCFTAACASSRWARAPRPVRWPSASECSSTVRPTCVGAAEGRSRVSRSARRSRASTSQPSL
jgi:pimeloyl-ACP methyl ester carboxylesterase